jgi:autotransporter-associated beta strand protein
MSNSLLSYGSNILTIGSLAGSGTLDLGTGGGKTLQTGNDDSSTVFSGSISGDGNLVKEGSGRMTVSGDSSTTFVGTTAVIEGVLAVTGNIEEVSSPYHLGELSKATALSAAWMCKAADALAPGDGPGDLTHWRRDLFVMAPRLLSNLMDRSLARAMTS